MEAFLIIIVLVTAIILSTFCIGILLKFLRKKVEDYLKKDLINKDIPPEIYEKIKKQKDESLIQAIFIEDRASKLGWFTKTISLVELIVFAFLTFILLKETTGLLDGVKVFGVFLGAWLGIKVLSTHQVWSDPSAGKAYYYISLFGTFLNVLVAFTAGFFIHYIYFHF